MKREPSPSTTTGRLLRLPACLSLALLVVGVVASGSLARSAHHHALAQAGGVTTTSGITAHGQLVHPFKLNTNQSTNWSGYNQGTLEQGGKLFTSISGSWIVPRATPHVSGQQEYSADWIGIGGGCVDAGCTVTDSTLIQTGTEQDVGSNGKASYSAWYELIPAPSLTITGMTIHPGDRMSASIAEAAPNVELWTISIKDLSDHQSYSTTVPYSSSEDTAEWIEETPLIIGTNGGFAALPNLTTPKFDHAMTDGAPANLKSAEEMQLVNSSGGVIADPSAPDPDSDGFNVCAWASACAAPTSS